MWTKYIVEEHDNVGETFGGLRFAWISYFDGCSLLSSKNNYFFEQISKQKILYMTKS